MDRAPKDLKVRLACFGGFWAHKGRFGASETKNMGSLSFSTENRPPIRVRLIMPREYHPNMFCSHVRSSLDGIHASLFVHRAVVELKDSNDRRNK